MGSAQQGDFWISETLGRPGINSTSFPKSFLNVPSAPTTTGTTLVFTFHIRLISISKSLYLMFFSASLSAMFLSSGRETSIITQVLDFRSWMTMSGLLAKIFLSVIIESHKMVFSFIFTTLRYVFIPFVGNFTTKLMAYYPMNTAGHPVMSVQIVNWCRATCP